MFAGKALPAQDGFLNSETAGEISRLRMPEIESRKAGWVTKRVNDCRRVAVFE